jgi:hypothetical protein
MIIGASGGSFQLLPQWQPVMGDGEAAAGLVLSLLLGLVLRLGVADPPWRYCICCAKC